MSFSYLLHLRDYYWKQFIDNTLPRGERLCSYHNYLKVNTKIFKLVRGI